MENKNWKNLSVIQTIKSNMGILAGLVILCVVLSFTTSSFATVTNLFNVVRQITINLFLACGMTFVILLATDNNFHPPTLPEHLHFVR